MMKLKFKDMSTKKNFITNKYRLTKMPGKKSNRVTYFAVADAPSGTKSWRIISKDFYLENK